MSKPFTLAEHVTDWIGRFGPIVLMSIMAIVVVLTTGHAERVYKENQRLVSELQQCVRYLDKRDTH